MMTEHVRSTCVPLSWLALQACLWFRVFGNKSLSTKGKIGPPHQIFKSIRIY